jgi:hypothetical protein
MKTTTCDVWLLVDADGDFVAHHDKDQLVELYEDCVQPIADSGGYRVVRVAVAVPLPHPVELTAEAPALGLPVVKEVA